jgi:hypothetical protein
MASEKVREDRLRRVANRRGLRLLKSRRRDPRAADHGRYILVDATTNSVAYGIWNNNWAEATLDQIEEYLSSMKHPGEKRVANARPSPV